MKYRTFREFVIYKEGPSFGQPGQIPQQQGQKTQPNKNANAAEKAIMANPQMLKDPMDPRKNAVIDKAIKAKMRMNNIPLQTHLQAQSMTNDI